MVGDLTLEGGDGALTFTSGNSSIKIPDNKNSHPPLSRPVNKEKKEDKNKEKKEDKYQMFLL